MYYVMGTVLLKKKEKKKKRQSFYCSFVPQYPKLENEQLIISLWFTMYLGRFRSFRTFLVSPLT